jgi:hypothetical protein
MRFWLFLVALLVPSALTSLAQAAPCERPGVVSLRDLHVRVGGDELLLAVDDAPVVARPPASGAMHEVEVRSSLGFVATTEELPFVIRERLETGHGMVALTRDAPIDHVRADGDDLTLRVHFGGASIANLHAGCHDVVLGREASVAASRLEPLRLDETHWRPRTSSLVLHARPGAGPSIVMRFERGSIFAFGRAERRGAWTKVVWSDGYNRIAGWVRSAELLPSGAVAWGSTGGSGFGRCPDIGRASGPGVYQGPAALTPGAWVRDAPQGERWATVRVPQGFVVVQQEGAEWTRILIAPKVEEIGSCSLRHAWVRSSEVTLPDGARAPAPTPSAGGEAPGEEVLGQVVHGQAP